MALINCPECGKEVSDTAPRCPNCGHIINKKEANKTENSSVGGCGLVASILIALAIWALLG